MHASPNKLLICLIIFLVGCSNTANKTREDNSIAKAENIHARLLAHFHEWQGTPYKYGGLDKSGVDCSGYIFLSFQHALNQHVPRSTKLLAASGSAVKQSQLKTGDLVFFKTSKKDRHAGVYLSNREFMHASTSQGVMISSLDNVYWKKHYWMARRLD